MGNINPNINNQNANNDLARAIAQLAQEIHNMPGNDDNRNGATNNARTARQQANIPLPMQLISDGVGGIFGTLNSLFRFFSSQGFKQYMQMQKITGDLAANIGLARSESKGLLLNFTQLTTTAMEFGGQMSDIADIISSISDTTGKNRLISNEDVKNIEQLGRGTTLGVDGLSKMVGEFGNLGISMGKTFKLVENARDGAAKLGLNVGKVLTNYSTLVNGLTGFQMKSGLDNMVKLATQATQLRMDLSGVAESMSTAFFEPEGAVEAAAKMQVLGGQFAEKFGDAFSLMYKAQVSPEMFQKDIMDMVKGLAVKGENGLFYVPPQQMRMLQEVSKTIGVQYKDLLNGAIEQGKLADKFGVLSKNGIFFKNEQDRMAIANLIDFNEETGGYMIRMPDGEKKLLSDLTSQDQFQNILNQKKADEDAAKKRMNFTERLGNVFNRFQMTFSQVFAEIFDKLDNSGFLNMLDKGMTTLADAIIPAIKKLFDDKAGIGKMIDEIFKGVTAVLEKVINIFSGPGTLWEKLKGAITNVVVGVWDVVKPYLEIGFGKLFEKIGEVLPSWFGGNALKKKGVEMQLSGIAQSPAIAEKYNQSDMQKLMGKRDDLNDQTTLKQKLYALIGGSAGWGIGAALAPETAGLSLLIPLLGSIAGIGAGSALGSEDVNDAIVTKGRVLKGGKGDIPALFDEAGLRNNMSNNSGSSEIKHSGSITVKSEDGKQITISDLDKIGRYTLAQYIDSINHGMKNGTAVYNNEKMPIAPIS